LFKSLYKSGEYNIRGTPYKLRGAILPRKSELEEDLGRKKKEETPEEKLDRVKADLAEIEKLIADKQDDFKALQDEYAELMLKTDEDVRNLLLDAEKQALEIKEDARKKGNDEGYEKGYYEGIEKAKAEIDQKYSALLNTVKGISDTALAEKHKIIKNTEDDIVDMSIEIAKKVVNKELATDKKIIIGFVKEAIKLLEDKEKIIIYSHPQDIELIKSHRAEFMELVDTTDSLHILPDELLEPGECRLESKSEIIDTDIHYQFGEIKKKLHAGE
jgi:flagellar assembly protein FliH